MDDNSLAESCFCFLLAVSVVNVQNAGEYFCALQKVDALSACKLIAQQLVHENSGGTALKAAMTQKTVSLSCCALQKVDALSACKLIAQQLVHENSGGTALKAASIIVLLCIAKGGCFECLQTHCTTTST